MDSIASAARIAMVSASQRASSSSEPKPFGGMGINLRSAITRPRLGCGPGLRDEGLHVGEGACLRVIPARDCQKWALVRSGVSLGQKIPKQTKQLDVSARIRRNAIGRANETPARGVFFSQDAAIAGGVSRKNTLYPLALVLKQGVELVEIFLHLSSSGKCASAASRHCRPPRHRGSLQ